MYKTKNIINTPLKTETHSHVVSIGYLNVVMYETHRILLTTTAQKHFSALKCFRGDSGPRSFHKEDSILSNEKRMMNIYGRKWGMCSKTMNLSNHPFPP